MDVTYSLRRSINYANVYVTKVIMLRVATLCVLCSVTFIVYVRNVINVT